jgi:hypothetical protein
MAAFAFLPSPTADADPSSKMKGAAPSLAAPVHIGQGGDTIGSALPILSLPFSDSGTTVGYADDYAPYCTYGSHTAPDVVYSYAPAGDVTCIEVRLCGSTYDTALYVLEDVEDNVIACNDDGCALQSETRAPVSHGHTYYIIVDGYYDCSGTYQLLIEETGPCAVSCPAGSVIEGEPPCHDDYVDRFDGGCASDPPAFVLIWNPLGSATVCGEYGSFLRNGHPAWDVDWYEIYVPGDQSSLTWTVRGESDITIGIQDGRNGCSWFDVVVEARGAAYTDVTVTRTVDHGSWWLAVAGQWGPCGQDYVGTVECSSCYPLAVGPDASWGKIKSFYR